MTEKIIISVLKLSKKFGDVRAVDNISFDVKKNSIIALLGANGAGKTTTIAMLLGLLVPSSGEISIFGIDILKSRYSALSRMNFSSPYVDLPQRLSVYQNLKVYAQLYGIANEKERLSVLADDLQLNDLLHRKYRTLSAGQRTRVMLAKSLLNNPELLLLDEPTASLDPDSADWIRHYLCDYRERTGASIMLATHNMQEVERLCDQVLMMQGGRITDAGTPSELIEAYGRDSLEEVFLAVARKAPPKGMK
ncbi:MAG: ABC transporter ATP-binding protein [Pseudomonadota bacterium]|nr:ABC transporter ATP-binding protein [Pseudomonadota bacterium]